MAMASVKWVIASSKFPAEKAVLPLACRGVETMVSRGRLGRET
jgi:hypothetical protein